uniref:Uncharacterized protein n=1 Tax=Anguilla anguilla TaxID=7936 RepID=A0A0E9QC37_ANGAN
MNHCPKSSLADSSSLSMWTPTRQVVKI